MKMVVGLGNPGKEYENTRHNAGWMLLDYIAQRENISISEKKKNCDSIIGECYLQNQKVIFAKPQTFMNLSGNAVQKLKKWYQVEDQDILVLFDDIDIPFGEIRYKINGSGGTHNGMKNIVQMLSSKEIPRIKIGIGGLKHEKQDLANFVLQRFSKNEMAALQPVFEEAYEKLILFLDK